MGHCGICPHQFPQDCDLACCSQPGRLSRSPRAQRASASFRTRSGSGRAVSITRCGATTLGGAGSATIVGSGFGALTASSVTTALRRGLAGAGLGAGSAGVSTSSSAVPAVVALAAGSAGTACVAGAAAGPVAVGDGGAATSLVGWLRRSVTMIASRTAAKAIPAATRSRRSIVRRLTRRGAGCRTGVTV